jgi:hypothetical protein
VKECRAVLVLGRLLRLLLEARRRRRVGRRLTEPDGARRKQIQAFAGAGRAEKIPGFLQVLCGCAVMNALEETSSPSGAAALAA